MGTMMKNDTDVLTIQVKGNGPLGAMTAALNPETNGHVKGCVANPQAVPPLRMDIWISLAQSE